MLHLFAGFMALGILSLGIVLGVPLVLMAIFLMDNHNRFTNKKVRNFATKLANLVDWGN